MKNVKSKFNATAIIGDTFPLPVSNQEHFHSTNVRSKENVPNVRSEENVSTTQMSGIVLSTPRTNSNDRGSNYYASNSKDPRRFSVDINGNKFTNNCFPPLPPPPPPPTPPPSYDFHFPGSNIYTQTPNESSVSCTNQRFLTSVSQISPPVGQSPVSFSVPFLPTAAAQPFYENNSRSPTNHRRHSPFSTNTRHKRPVDYDDTSPSTCRYTPTESLSSISSPMSLCSSLSPMSDNPERDENILRHISLPIGAYRPPNYVDSKFTTSGMNNERDSSRASAAGNGKAIDDDNDDSDDDVEYVSTSVIENEYYQNSSFVSINNNNVSENSCHSSSTPLEEENFSEISSAEHENSKAAHESTCSEDLLLTTKTDQLPESRHKCTRSVHRKNKLKIWKKLNILRTKLDNTELQFEKTYLNHLKKQKLTDAQKEKLVSVVQERIYQIQDEKELHLQINIDDAIRHMGNRQRFKTILDELEIRELFNSIRSWKDIYNSIKTHKYFSILSKEAGCGSFDIFKFCVDSLNCRFLKMKQIVKDVLDEQDFEMNADTSHDEFCSAIEQHCLYPALSKLSIRYIFTELKNQESERFRQAIVQEILKGYTVYV